MDRAIFVLIGIGSGAVVAGTFNPAWTWAGWTCLLLAVALAIGARYRRQA